MDYCSGGELFYLLKRVRRMSEDEARVYFIQILLGIEYIHSMGYMYRDLKPENILIDAHGFAKIADFGLAKPRSKKSFSFCGSVEYMAPEIIEGKGHNSSVDYYCLGTILFEMVMGYPPFYNARSSLEETKTRILLDSVEFPKHMKFSE
jgi:serum/glucocorticoid-regulated kinase 2